MNKLKILTLLSALIISCGVPPCGPVTDATNFWTSYCPPPASYPIYDYDVNVARHSFTPWAANFAGPSCVIYTPMGHLQNLGGICPPLNAVPCNGVCDIYGNCQISCFAKLYF